MTAALTIALAITATYALLVALETLPTPAWVERVLDALIPAADAADKEMP